MTELQALILGIIQGLTEFLPVSSSGHIELGKVILGANPPDPLLFSIVVHGATALSTIVIFWKSIWQILRDLFKFQWNESTQYVVKIAVSMIPVGIVGVLWEKQIEALFEKQVLLVGAMLIITGLLLYFSTRAKETEGRVSFPKAIIIGLAQAIAILPGISRSGSTIGTSLLLGVSREEAARFSFLMVLPPILGAMLLKVKKYLELTGEASADVANLETTTLGIGFIAAFVTGLVACTWMIKLVKQGKLIYFALYCWIVGAIAIGYTLFF